jgi:hypothetical protein
MGLPSNIEIGQHWSVWVPSRQQWLLAAVTRQKDHHTVLQFDARYGMARASSEHVTETVTMLSNTQLFRFIANLS